MNGPSRNHRALDFLREQPWARELVKEVEDRGGISNHTNEGDLFTMRFGWEMALACPTGVITYEFRAGVGRTSVDFRLQAGGRTWLFECMAINPSTAARKLEKKEQICRGISISWLTFSGSAEERGERPEAELHRVYQAIWQHVWDQHARCPAKFPARSQNSANVLVVSLAGFLGRGLATPADCIEIVHGSRRLLCPDADLEGLLEGNNADPGATAVRDRVDLLVFVDDVHGIYDDLEIRRSSCLRRNPSSEPWVETEYPVLLCSSLRDPLHSRD
jgi:hypothetical protein